METNRKRVCRRGTAVVVIAVVVSVLWCVQAGATSFGINAHIPSAFLLDEMTAAGIEWVRIDFLWSLVEPEENVLDWSTYDRLVARIEARGLRVFATISDPPAWAIDSRGVPSDPDDWRDICYRSAARYRGRIQAWGMWNEPNLDRFWGGTRAEYINLILINGGEAVHAADPQALVCGPDLAHLSTDWDDWLLDIVTRAATVLDVVTHHVYPSDGLEWDIMRRLVSGTSNPWDPPPVKEVLVDAGWFGKPFWITEIGVESDEWGEYTQAYFYTEVLEDWFGADREQRWIDKIFFYEMRDTPSASTFGLIAARPSTRRKRAYDAYAGFIAGSAVDDAEPVTTTLPAFITPLTTFKTTVRFANTGTSSWDTGTCRLSLSGTADWQPSEDDLEIDREIPPGTSALFTLVMTSPAGANTPIATTSHTLTWRMARDGEGAFGTPLKTRIWVSPNAGVEINAQPRSAGVRPGDTVVFSVETGTLTAGFHRWLRNSIELEEGERFTGVFSPTLTVHDAGPDVTGEYYCVVTSVNGGYLSSRPAVLAISPQPRQPGGLRVPAANKGSVADH